MSSDINKFHFRLVLLGSNETGKTSILNRFLFKKFEPKYKPTVEDLFSKDFDLGSIEIKVDFLDTSGSMQFPAMRRLSITTGDAFLIVYALDDEKSYEVVKLCMAEIRECRADFQEIPIVFAGNKSDLVREQRRVPKELVSNYVHYELPRLRAKVIECSCKDNSNIDSIFRAYLSLARVSVSTSAAIIAKASGGRPLSAAQTGGLGGVNQQSTSSFSGRHGSAAALTGSGAGKRPSSAVPPSTNSTSASSNSRRPSSTCGSPKDFGHGGNGRATPTGMADELAGNGGHQEQAAAAEGEDSSSCVSSIKSALGVRKSCDASIVSSLRKVSLGTGSSARSSREQLLEEVAMSGSGEWLKRPEVEQPRKNSAASSALVMATQNHKNNMNSNDASKFNYPPITTANNQQKQQQQQLDNGTPKGTVTGTGTGIGTGNNNNDNIEANNKQVRNTSSIESILKSAAAAAQNSNNNKLTVSQTNSKPRSRSLIWRPHRKSSRTSGSQAADECRVV